MRSSGRLERHTGRNSSPRGLAGLRDGGCAAEEPADGADAGVPSIRGRSAARLRSVRAPPFGAGCGEEPEPDMFEYTRYTATKPNPTRMPTSFLFSAPSFTGRLPLRSEEHTSEL